MCIDDMFEEINCQNVEILCQMLNKLAAYQVQTSIQTRLDKTEGKKINHESSRQ